MADLSDIDAIVTDVIMEEEEVSNMPTESDIDGASISASQVGPSDIMPRITPSPGTPQQRPGSALTVENLRLHEQNVGLEENPLSRQGSANSGQRDRPISRESLGPVRTPGSGTPVRLCSGKSGGLGNITDGTTPGPDDIHVRTGSGKREPLPPIGSDPVSLQQNGVDVSRLSVSRENQDDQDTVTSLARMSARSERSVSFRDGADRSRTPSSAGKRKKDVNSPAIREVHKVKGMDGSERVTISCATETEWSWLQMITFLGKTEEELASIGGTLRPKTPTEPTIKSALSSSSKGPISDKLQSREGSRYVEEDDGVKETQGEEKDEVPPLQMDSDSEFSDEDEVLKSDQGVPKIGPPQIIKYQRESEQVPISQKYKDAAHVVGQELDFDFNDFDSADLSEEEDKELEARIRGKKKYSEDEYDYPYDDPPGKVDVKASRSKNLGDDLDDRTTPPLSTVNEVAEVCEFCNKDAKTFPTHEMLKSMSQSELFCCKDYQDLVEYTIENTPLSQYPSEEMIDVGPHAPYGSKQARRAAKERAAQRLRDREMARQRAAGTNQANFYALQVARQMKTINYSLSSQKCLDEGWTKRPPTPEEPDHSKPVYVPEPTTPHLPVILKTRKKGRKETPIVRRHYRSGELFMVMFEDGTGAVFYPSGALAILITLVEKNQFSYYVQADGKPGEAKFLAVFEPNGKGTCYHGNGNIRLNVNQFGGVFTDRKGSIKKRWSWKDEDTLSKTPPFQPLCFSLNQQISVRCMMQEQIFINFNCDLQSCRFNAGAKLKLVGPDQVPLKAIDRDMLYISEVKTYVQMVLDQIFNQKTFSKSPKLDSLRPPLQIQNAVRKNERLKQKVAERRVNKKAGGVVTVK
ncbi:uncharacterized protein LOC764814 isoform X2 [Strongylocentrotus purpuratus]|uniref:FAM194 C-terminal domain-containing protein n=1 Tax=Strongylocentrotus purpuratus TaxID=7668 RepID=A0A7M7NLL4_STRPU|nr:uncharacterized protein LOC764814 isoform X2 [Strongylocentrotus purpuratus]